MGREITKQDVRKIVPIFQFRGPLLSIQHFGSGHINDTYKLTVRQGGSPIEYILQRVNHIIFPNVPGMMSNIIRVTKHMRKKLLDIPGSDFSREALRVIFTQENEPFYVDSNGDFWRAYVFIERSISYDFVSEPNQAYEAARTFGRFQKLLQDFPNDPPLEEVIPDFHNTPKRYERFHKALIEDRLGRAAGVKDEIEFFLQREEHSHVVVDLLASGEIPTRVTHNDTKINNVMFDLENDTGLCVVDLDTVMQGSSLYDFGDQVRTATATAAEDERDLGKVSFRMDMFEALVQGFLEETRYFLVPRELSLLAFSGRLITLEIGLRFLTDYLEGDHYFKTAYPEHNLIRCHTQMEMLRQMEEHAEEMETVVRRYAGIKF